MDCVWEVKFTMAPNKANDPPINRSPPGGYEMCVIAVDAEDAIARVRKHIPQDSSICGVAHVCWLDDMEWRLREGD